MTERLYYGDAYTRQFEARILERIKKDDQLAVVLDQTYFYPASGGQPADLGHLGETTVVDVAIRPSDGAILHHLGGEVWADEVSCHIDWNRRFDHMQQHTGQHILSQAFQRVALASTVSFHLGKSNATIDLHRHDLAARHVEDAELLANEIIWENRRVRAFTVTPEQAQKLPLRGTPTEAQQKLRLVEIDDFDLSACGGTHVAWTGEVGQIKIVKLERRGAKLRVNFCCGQRALRDYRLKNSIIGRLGGRLTTGHSEIEAAVSRLQEELKEARRQHKDWQQRLNEREAAHLIGATLPKRGTRIIRAAYGVDDGIDLPQLARLLAQEPGTVALLGMSGEQAKLAFARAEDAPGTMNLLIKPALQILGAASGGGTAQFARGGGPAGDIRRVQQALKRAEKLLLAQLSPD